MAEFFSRILTYQFALTLVAALICFVAYGYPVYQSRATNNPGSNGFVWLLWLIAGIICVAVIVKIMFGL